MSTRKFPTGEEICNLRKSKKLSQTAFGAIASISFRAVSLIETGRQKPSAGTLLLWAEEFKTAFGLDWVKRHLAKRGQTKNQPEDQSGIRMVKIIGRIAAGEPSEAIMGDFGEIEIAGPRLEGIRNPRALRVTGESMADLHILSGDVVIIGDSSIYQNRIVAAYEIEGGDYSITLKVWKRRGGTIELQPRNPKYRTRIYTRKSKKQLRAFGVVFQVIRNYDYSQPITEYVTERGDGE